MLNLGGTNANSGKHGSLTVENGLFNGAGGMGGMDNDSLSNDEDEDDEDGDDYWHTSVGKFKFTLDQLPQTLQYIHQLLTVTALVIVL